MVGIDGERRAILLSRLGVSADSVPNRLQEIKNNAHNEWQLLHARYPTWNAKGDVRLAFFVKLINHLGTTQFMLDILCKLADDDWCAKNVGHSAPNEETADFLKWMTADFERLAKWGFAMGVFVSVETTIRALLRGIAPCACKRGTAPFQPIYMHLLGKNQLAFPRTAIVTLDFMRELRNLIHNDGVYFDKHGKDKSIRYKCATYDLRHGQSVDFVTWGRLLDLTDELQQLLAAMIKHEKIASVNMIADIHGEDDLSGSGVPSSG